MFAEKGMIIILLSWNYIAASGWAEEGDISSSTCPIIIRMPTPEQHAAKQRRPEVSLCFCKQLLQNREHERYARLPISASLHVLPGCEHCVTSSTNRCLAGFGHMENCQRSTAPGRIILVCSTVPAGCDASL